MTATANTPEIKVNLNLEPSIQVAGKTQPVSMRGLGRVILFLVFLRGASVSRPMMARRLWPGEPDDVVFNRLRVSLTRLKTLVGEALVADRNLIRLTGLIINIDLLEIGERLQEALDEVNPELQFELLKKHSQSLQSVGWRAFTDLDTSGLLSDWDAVCKQSIRQLMETAVQKRDWDSVDFVWQLMHNRGDIDIEVCEKFLDASDARGELDAGLQRIKRSIQDQGRDDASVIIASLTKYSLSLKKTNQPKAEFQTSHAQLLGSALLGHLERYAASLAELVVTPEVQFQMQSLPILQLQILEAVQAHLETGSSIWVDVQSARLAAYGSIYDSEKVLDICQSLFPCEMTPLRASTTWMHHSFCMFQIRQWDDALSSVKKAQNFAILGGETARFEVGRLTEAAYLWHLGKVLEATTIYDDYLARYGDSSDFTLGVNAVIAHVNYAIVELNFGEIEKAKRHVDIAYSQRTTFNLTRLLPNLLSSMGLIYARTDEIYKGVDFAIDGLKQTYARGSSREGQLNMEWACGILVIGGLKPEAWQVMNWANEWRKSTKHTRSVCEELYAKNLGLQEFDDTKPMFSEADEYRYVMSFLIKCLRRVQKSTPAVAEADR